jgi:hypothetical protein
MKIIGTEEWVKAGNGLLSRSKREEKSSLCYAKVAASELMDRL